MALKLGTGLLMDISKAVQVFAVSKIALKLRSCPWKRGRVNTSQSIVLRTLEDLSSLRSSLLVMQAQGDACDC